MILGKFSLNFLQGHPDHPQYGDDQGSKGHSAQVVSQGAMQGAGEAWRAATEEACVTKGQKFVPARKGTKRKESKTRTGNGTGTG